MYKQHLVSTCLLLGWKIYYLFVYFCFKMKKYILIELLAGKGVHKLKKVHYKVAKENILQHL